jgi:hypothetical protein
VRKTQPAQLDIRGILAAAFDVRDEDPEYFAQWLLDAYSGEADEWHQQPVDGAWHHHASTLVRCLRQHILERSGVPQTPLSLESLITFHIGREMHLLLQMGLAVHPDITLHGHETGGWDAELGIAAHTDAVFEIGGVMATLDLKSEKAWASTGRKRDAQAEGRTSTERPGDRIQLQATAAILRRLTPYDPTVGWLVYFEKDSGSWELCEVDVTAEAAPVEWVAKREDAWSRWLWTGVLPPVLPSFPDKGLCNAKYCRVREHCLVAHEAEVDRLQETGP